MSWKVASICNGRKFGSAIRKQIIMYLADKASDDGEGIWCSKPTIARECELSESGVKNVIRDFVAEGILIECGTRKIRNGYTCIYKINLEKVRELDALGGHGVTPSPDNGVTRKPPTPSQGDPLGGHGVTPNNPKTIQKPYTRARDEWDLGTKFVPQGSRDVDLEIWKMALDDMGIFPIERVFDLKWQNAKEGWVIPSKLPPRGEEKRHAFLKAWLEAQGKDGSLAYAV